MKLYAHTLDDLEYKAWEMAHGNPGKFGGIEIVDDLALRKPHPHLRQLIEMLVAGEQDAAMLHACCGNPNIVDRNGGALLT